MEARGRLASRIAAGIGTALLLAGCTDPSATTSPTASSTPPAATSAGRVACAGFEVRELDIVPGDWTLAEAVALRGPAGAGFTVALPAQAEASVAFDGAGTPPAPGRATTITEAQQLTLERATVTTDPDAALDPATLLAAIGQLNTAPLSLANTGQAGFSGSLQGELGPGTTVVYRGAQEATVAFTGDCTGPTGDPVPIAGTARYFGSDTAGVLDCGRPSGTDTLASLAAQHCTTE